MLKSEYSPSKGVTKQFKSYGVFGVLEKYSSAPKIRNFKKERRSVVGDGNRYLIGLLAYRSNFLFFFKDKKQNIYLFLIRFCINSSVGFIVDSCNIDLAH